MDGAEGRRWRLRWGALLAGAALAAAIGWVGDLTGGFLAMLEPGRAGGFAWLGGVVTLAMLLAGTFLGGGLAARLAGPLDREETLLHGLLVWALVTLAAAAEFTVLGAGPVVISASDGQLRLALGGGAIGLALAAASAAAGALAARRESRGTSFRRRTPSVPPPEPRAPTSYAPPPDEPVGPGGPLPPGLHR